MKGSRYSLCPIQFVPDTICSRYSLFPIQFVPDTICADTICADTNCADTICADTICTDSKPVPEFFFQIRKLTSDSVGGPDCGKYSNSYWCKTLVRDSLLFLNWDWIKIWNSWMAFLVRVSGRTLNLLRLEFLSGFLPSFFLLHNFIHD